ncbi:MAG: peptidase M55 [Tindallia sp. MSAO_Bac2]|nr:MAG: peptidase M55 [Tindallia sp. MSAO_Bac2]
MKVYVSADLEGIWGVVSRKQLGGENPDYSRARRLMTEEVNLVCRELFKNGATEVLVNDAHGPMDNLMIEELHPDANLISGYPKDLSMMEGVADGVDCAMLIGYHPKVGTTKGLFEHTYASNVVSQLTINGEILGETGLNALVAGHYNIPVVLVAGDWQVTQDAKIEIGNIETVGVKKAVSRYCARHISQNQLQEAYAVAITKALKNIKQAPVKKPALPITLNIKLAQVIMAEQAAVFPGAKLLDEFTIEYEARDVVEMYKAFRAIVTLAAKEL